MIQCGNLCGVHKFPRWLLCKEKNIGTLKSFQKAKAGLSNKKSGQTVVTAPSRLQPVAPALVGATGYDSPLGGKSGQVLPCARRLQPDGPGDFCGRGLGRVGQVLQDLGLARSAMRLDVSPLFYRHFFRNQRQQRGALGAETLGDLRRFPALLLPDGVDAGQAAA